MLKIAIYGKGGIGKSTIACNLSAALAEKGYKVMQIGCDPKSDSTMGLCGERITSVLELVRKNGDDIQLEDMVRIGYNGVICVEAGGPVPGLGCAGRGMIAALEKLQEKGAYEKYDPDVVIYDVLGDVVCGGFSMPMRKGHADKVFIVTSGESMSCYAAANIAMAVDNFKNRGYAKLGGIIFNRRDVDGEEERVKALCKDFSTSVVGEISRSKDISDCDMRHKTVIEECHGGISASEFFRLADDIVKNCIGQGEKNAKEN